MGNSWLYPREDLNAIIEKDRNAVHRYSLLPVTKLGCLSLVVYLIIATDIGLLKSITTIVASHHTSLLAHSDKEHFQESRRKPLILLEMAPVKRLSTGVTVGEHGTGAFLGLRVMCIH